MGNNHKFANIGLNMKKNKVVKTGIIFSQNIKTTTIYKCVRPWIPGVAQGRMECFAESAWMAKQSLKGEGNISCCGSCVACALSLGSAGPYQRLPVKSIFY